MQPGCYFFSVQTEAPQSETQLELFSNTALLCAFFSNLHNPLLVNEETNKLLFHLICARIHSPSIG